MSALALGVEWEDAPGVTDAALAQTWARLEIDISGACVTRLLDHRSRGERSGVYGSLFPLAEWIVENWWSLLNEAPQGQILSARGIGARGRAWMRRHDLLTARAGGSLPDLVFARDGEHIVATWTEDPPDAVDRPVRFLAAGQARLGRHEVEQALGGLVNVVISRLEGVEGDAPARLRADWSEIARSQQEERVLCERAARLGLDPYDREEVTDEIASALERGFDLPVTVLDDFLDAASRRRLAETASAVRRALAAVTDRKGPVLDVAALRAKLSSLPADGAPYRAGYHLAAEVRSKILGLEPDEPIVDLQATIADRMLWDDAMSEVKDLTTSSVRGLVGLSSTGTAHLALRPASRQSRRFQLSRAIHEILTGRCAAGPRLLTEAATSAQAAGRAFAAELLAPAAALRLRVEEVVTEDQIDELATEFDVSDLVILHQLQNHGIAELVPD